MTKQEKLSKISNNLTVAIAEEKARRAAAEAEYYANVHRLQKGAQEMKEAVYNEPDEPQGEQEQPVVWADGKQHTAAIVARRILRKLPPIPYNCSVDISINHYTEGIVSLQVKGYNPNRKGHEFAEVWINGYEDEEKQAEIVAAWFKNTEDLFAFKPDNGHVAEPIAHALDAIWGGSDPVSELNDIVDGVVRKEADNE